MRLYRNDNTNPSLNLALEEWLVTTAADDCFMLWRNRPAIIVGRNQNAAAEINQDFVQKNNIAVERRLSGIDWAGGERVDIECGSALAVG